MNKLRFLFVPVLVVMLLLGSLNTVQAVPPTPSSFYGEIHFQSGDGVPSAGEFIDAYVPGATSYVAQIAITSDSGSLVYAINVPGEDADVAGKQGGIEGEIVTFKIGARIVGTGVWHTGKNVRLDIHPPKANAGGVYVKLVNEAVSFTGSVLGDWLGSDTFSYAWDLDNDLAYDDSTLQNPSHPFSTTGVKPVGLQVTDSVGGASTTTASAVVVSLSGLTGQIYDGTAKSVTVGGLETGYSSSVTYGGSETAPTNAGSYAVIVTIKYGATVLGTIGKTMVIDPKSASVTADAAGKEYGAADPPLTGTLTGFLPEDGATVIFSRTAGEDVGTYDISAILSLTGELGNYSITSNTAVFTISIANTTSTLACAPNPVTVNSGSVCTVTVSAAGTIIPSGTVNFSKNGSDLGNFSAGTCNLSTGSCSVTYTPSAVGVATHRISASYGGTSNFNPSSGYADVAVNQASQTITVGTPAPATAAYGSSFTVAATASSGLTVAYSSGSPSVCTVLGATFTMVSGSGTCAVQYDQAGNANYSAATQVTENVTAQKKAASVTPDASGKVFGAGEPALTGTLTGFLTADGIAATYSRVAGESLGTYLISATLIPIDKLANYNITYNTALFTISVTQHSISLASGWNLVSFNLHPSSTATADVLGSISGSYDLVYAWDATGGHSGAGNWMKYDPFAFPTANTLLSLDEKMGFWIHMTAADTLVVNGTYADTTNISLVTTVGGWNLVGYPSASSSTLPEILTGLGTNDTRVYAYHPTDSRDPWKLYDQTAPGYVNDLNAMEPGWGYWIYVTANHTLTVVH